jgi:hypothetical protein
MPAPQTLAPALPTRSRRNCRTLSMQAEAASQELGFVSGHDFSRAVND